jgi:hypothetical protein
MRTKTLLLTAALSVAGVATSMAQVFSVNAVGYVNTTLQPGFNLISNPLIAAKNSIASLFADVHVPGAQIFKFNNTTKAYASWTFDDIDNAFTGSTDPNTVTLQPGEGVFVRLPGTAPLTITFIGDVPQGTGANSLKTPIEAGLNMLSSKVPQAGAADTDLALPAPTPGDQFFKYDAAGQKYASSTFDDIDNAWTTPLSDAKLKLNVGDAFFYSNKGAAKTWTREFSANQ